MKKLKLLFLSLSVVPLFISAQNRTIDSLENLLKQTVEDIDRVEILYQLSDNSMDNQNMMDYAKQALELAEKSNYKKGMGNALNNIGLAHFQRGDYEKALEYYLESLKIWKETEDKRGMAISFNNLGTLYERKGNQEKALEYYLEGLKIREKIKDENPKDIKSKEDLASSLHNLGAFFESQNKSGKAIEYLLRSLTIYEEMCGEKVAAAIQANAMDMECKRGMAYTLQSIAVVYHHQGDIDKSLNYFLKSVKIHEEIGDKFGAANCLNNIGAVYKNKGVYDKALHYYLESLKLKQEIGDKRGIAHSFNHIGIIYKQQKNFSQALLYQEKALAIGRELNDPDIIRRASLHLSEIYSLLKNYKEAYEYHRLYSQFKDSLFNEESSRQIAEMQTKYETEKKEQENVLLKKNNEIQFLKLKRSRAWIYSLASFLVLSFIIFGLLYNRHRIRQRLHALEQQRREANMQRQLTDLELKALRAQMDPHFIFNCINSIQHCINSNNLEAADNYLSKFARLLRLILETSRTPNIRLADEIKLLQLYLEMEALRFESKFQYSVKADDSIDIENVEIPTMLIQPYVENALKHGIRSKEKDGKVTVFFSRENGNLKVAVEDNGIGRKRSQELKGETTGHHRSLGMLVTQQRLDSINSRQGEQAKVNIHDLTDDRQQPLGTRVEIRIPI